MIPLTGAGGLMTRLGLIGGLVNTINSERGVDVPAKIVTLAGQFTSGDQALIDSLFSALTSHQKANSGLLTFLQRTAADIVIEMVRNDQIQPDSSLQTALTYLFQQMTANAQSVKRATPTASYVAETSPANFGNGALVLSAKLRNGLVAENIVPELISLSVTADSQTGSRPAGSELLSWAGQQSQPNELYFDWPTGSGASGSLVNVDASLDAQSGGNLLTNSDWERFTVANTPDHWAISLGTPGTTVFKDTSHPYAGTNSLRLHGNGTELTELAQKFNSGSGTLAKLQPLTQYAVNVWALMTALPAAGVLQIALTDGASIVNDAAGNPNSFTQSLPALPCTCFTPIGGSFRTPAVLPANLYLRVKLTTALTAGADLYLDSLALANMTSLYTQGLYARSFRGSLKVYQGDEWLITTTNDWGGGAAGHSFQSLFDRLFDMKSLGMLVPSSLTPTISDGLIT